MDEAFELEVLYKGKKYEFETKLVLTGYTYQFHTTVQGAAVIFERDDEANFRAIAAHADEKSAKALDPALLQQIAQALEALLA